MNIKPIKKPTNNKKSGLAELPFNQFKNDKDFLNALDEFFDKRPHELKQKSGLAELPFNQFKYDKDFLNALDEFFDKDIKRPREFKLVKLQSPTGKFLKTYEMKIPYEYVDPIVFFTKAQPLIEDILREKLEALEGLKFSVGFEVVFIKFGTKPPVFTDPPIGFYTKQRIVLNLNDTNVDPEVADILNRIEKFVQNGSGWQLYALNTLWLDIAEYKPIRGSSYIPLPDALKNKRAIVNVKKQ